MSQPHAHKLLFASLRAQKKNTRTILLKKLVIINAQNYSPRKANSNPSSTSLTHSRCAHFKVSSRRNPSSYSSLYPLHCSRCCHRWLCWTWRRWRLRGDSGRQTSSHRICAHIPVWLCVTWKILFNYFYWKMINKTIWTSIYAIIIEVSAAAN